MFPRVPWPPPAHQGDLFPRGYGVYSSYTPGDPGLYSPSAKLPPAFIPTPKVTEPLFAITGASHIPGVSVSSRFQQLEIRTKSVYTPPSVKNEALNGCASIPPALRVPEPATLGSSVAVIDLSTSDSSKKSVKLEGQLQKKKRTLPMPTHQGGCSRTTPLTLRPPEVLVKKEPESLLSPTLETSVFLSPSSDTDVKGVKLEAVDISAGKARDTRGLSPVGNGVVSRRCQQFGDSSPCVPQPMQEPTPILAGAIYNGGGLCDDRSTNLLPSWPAQAHNPTLWQYSAPMEQYPGYPVPLGYQLIRDPLSGHLLLLPSANIEQMPRTIFWPPQMLLPPAGSQHILLESSVSNTPHLVLESSVRTSMDFMTSEPMHHQAPQRRILLTNEKMVSPTVIKLEADCSSTAAVVVTACGNSVFSKEVEENIRIQETPPAEVLAKQPDSPPAPILSPPSTRIASPPPSTPEAPDVTGLELLSNSIEKHVVEKSAASPLSGAKSLGGAKPLGRLAVLCALAEQLRGDDSMEETVKEQSPQLIDTPPSSPCDERESSSSSDEGELSSSRSDEGEMSLPSDEAEVAPSDEEGMSPPGNKRVMSPPGDEEESCSPSDEGESSSPSDEGELPPPILEKVSDIMYEEESEILRPPKLTPHLRMEEPDSQHNKSSSSDSSDAWISPETEEMCEESRKRSTSEEPSPPSSSKKRKVGRPKKHLLTTEVMVVKKKTISESSKLRKIRSRTKVDKEPPTLENHATLPEATSLKPCVALTAAHLTADQLPLRVLMAKDSVFHAAQLIAIEAPDVYGITIDGERRHRPDIFSREEIMKNTILEVKPRCCADVPIGARICAYWSELSRCLYPGTVTALADAEVDVEFDDGDSGRIAITNVRLLPPGYPVSAGDHRLVTSKRKRSIDQDIGAKCMSSTVKVEESDEKESAEPDPEQSTSSEDVEDVRRDPEQERRHLKKKRREKLKRLQSLSIDGIAHKERSSKHHRHKRHGHHHKKHKKHKHRRKERAERTVSTESRSQMAKLLPPTLIWDWADEGFSRGKKIFHRSIRQGTEIIKVGDSAVFLSTGRPDRPYIGRIESFWQAKNGGQVRVKWFYHPEETVMCSAKLKYPGALFESPHGDPNDVQTISHKCDVLPVEEFQRRLEEQPSLLDDIYNNNDLFYLAGYYDPTSMTMKMRSGVEEGT